MNWSKIKDEFLSGASISELAQKYSIAYKKIYYRARTENWLSQKDPTVRIKRAADKLLSRIEQAADEIDLYIIKNKIKTKTVEYSGETGKIEKETIAEDEAIGTDKGMVDRTELKQLVSTLRELKDIYSENSSSEGQLEALIKGLKDDE